MYKQESSTLNITRFIMSICIVFLHAYTTVQMYPFLHTYPLYQYTGYILSMQCGEIAVPSFFLISGYLFFIGYKQTWGCYSNKIHKRVYTLLIPYLFWNAFILALYYGAECIPSIRELFNDGKKLVHDFGFTDFLGAFWARKDGGPILDQLWFVRNLILLSVGAPVAYLFVRYARLTGVIALGLFWMLSPGMAYPQSSLFYFSLGAWFSINGRSLTDSLSRITAPLLVCYPLIVIADLLLIGTSESFYVHRMQTFTGVFFIIALVSWLVNKGKIRDIAFLSSSSFFLYVTHDPMLRFMRKLSFKFMDQQSELQVMLSYFGAIVLDIAIVYAAYWFLQKYAPKLLTFTTGR